MRVQFDESGFQPLKFFLALNLVQWPRLVWWCAFGAKKGVRLWREKGQRPDAISERRRCSDKRNAAAGVDGVTWHEYEKILYTRVHDLHREIHTGTYCAQASRRVYIPKADGKLRPLGVAAIEDKMVQQAVVKVLSMIYEEDFLGFSYGFRQGRGQHDALDALYVGIESRKVNWILNADIQAFFERIDHKWMLKYLDHRIGDQRLLRRIRK